MFYPQRFGFLMTMNYWADFDEPFRMGASSVDRTLRGTRPADLPVEQVSTFRLVINACAAKAMGLTTPRDLLARADEVIE